MRVITSRVHAREQGHATQPRLIPDSAGLSAAKVVRGTGNKAKRARTISAGSKITDAH